MNFQEQYSVKRLFAVCRLQTNRQRDLTGLNRDQPMRQHTATLRRDFCLRLSFLSIVLTAGQSFSQTITVQGQTYRETVELQGASVHGYQVTQISAKLGGFVKSVGSVDDVEVDVGSKVSRGDTLAVLDIPEMQNDLAEKAAVVQQSKSSVVQADAAIVEAEALVAQKKAELEQVKAGIAAKQAMLKLTETRLRRLTKLAASGTIGRDNLDESEFDVEAARASLQSVQADIAAAGANIRAAEASVAKSRADKVSAEASVTVAESHVNRLKVMMNYLTIKAPYDGVITKRNIDIGSFVQPAQNNSAAMPLFELTQVSRIRIMVAVPNNSVTRVKPGQTVHFSSIGGLEGQSFTGKISRIAGALDLITRTMQIEAHLDNPATDSVSGRKVELRPGLFGTLTVIRKDWKGDELLPVVPTTAIGKDEAGNYFVVVVKNGKGQKRTVSVAFNDAAAVGIRTGLTIGEKVLQSGVSKYQK